MYIRVKIIFLKRCLHPIWSLLLEKTIGVCILEFAKRYQPKN